MFSIILLLIIPAVCTFLFTLNLLLMKQIQLLFLGPAIILFTGCSCFYARAQKLPKTQEKSLRIPENLKIDGQLTELNNNFQAYNNTTSLYYTIANDDENLYVAFQAIQPRVIAKILYSGITFTVNPEENKKDAESIAITYPNMPQNDSQSIISKAGIKILSSVTGRLKQDEPPKLSDSAINILTNLITTKAKTIKVSGLKSITDSTLSVYNADGLKLAAAINGQQAYNYEMLIPLKLLGLSVNQTKSFSYVIKVRSRLETGKFQVMYLTTMQYSNVDPNADLDSTTKFEGKYTLSQKQ